MEGWGGRSPESKNCFPKINLWVLNSPKCMGWMCGLWNHGTFPQIKPFWGLTRGLRNLKKPFNEGGNVRQGLSCFISSNFPRWKWKHKILRLKVCVFLEHLFFSVFRCFRVCNNSPNTTLSHLFLFYKAVATISIRDVAWSYDHLLEFHRWRETLSDTIMNFKPNLRWSLG